MFATSVTHMCLLLSTFLIHTSETKTIVSIPAPFTSHARYYTNVARVLASRGHQAWVTLPTYLLEKGYLDTSGFGIIPFDTTPELEEQVIEQLKGCYFEGRQLKFSAFAEIFGEMIDTLLKNETFLRIIEQKNADLIVIENGDFLYTLSVIPYRLGIPFAFLGSYYHPSIMKIPFSPAEVPFGIFPDSNKMTFFQRLHNTYFFILFTMYNPSFPINAVSTYAPEMEYLPLDILVTRAEIFLVEQDYVLDYPKPILPNVKLIGGTVMGPAKPLPPAFQSFMDNAKEGVVIVSLGSYVLHLPEHISDKILQVLLQLPMKSVFRSDLTSPDPKILTAPWIPQNDLLGHPHTKVIVSHCGKNGLYEALYHAVPVVAIPIFRDQPYNAERVRRKGFAEVLDLKTCTAEQMTSTILTVVNEPKYKQSIIKYSRLFKELYGVPTETATYWLEHVMEYSGDYMRSAGQEMPFYQYVLLDVFLFVVCVLALTVGVICLFIKAICRYFNKRKLKAE